MRSLLARPLRSAPLLSLALATPWLLAAQDRGLPGYSTAAARTQRVLEAEVVRRTSADTARRHADALAGVPHVAGTPAQARTRDYVIAAMRRWGLETEVRTYDVWLPHATSVGVWRVSPNPRSLPLAEPPLAQDPSSRLPQYPTVNGYSAAGDVTAEVVYVNYGLIEDYAQLDSAGVSVRGKIAVARYGRSFRGIKAREAERHGAVALLLYSDPADDGYVQGDVFPEGPWRPGRGVQRGSVMNGIGDPSTPGWGSTRGARRIPRDSMVLPRIPVVPIGYDNAAELLRHVRGASIPPGWQGGLPFRYRVGPGPVRARVRVTLDDATRGWKPIWNTIGVLRGSERPEELVIIGAHRDAWGAGAMDDVSGTISVLEAARVLGELARAGQRPRRTILFATWDAEEWGIIGSTEFVEEDSLRLLRSAVAYLNQDVGVSGPNFGGGGSPSLRSTLRDLVRAIPDPSGSGSVYDVWRQRARPAADSLEPAMGDPGGGSDFAGFYNHLGIPHADWGFGGGGGIYHSAYDGNFWMRRFGDPGYRYHAATAGIGAAMLLRLANAEVLPFDYVEFARTMRGFVPPLAAAIRARGWSLPTERLVAAIDTLSVEARRFASARDAVLDGSLAAERADSVNAALLRVERALTRAQGLRRRPWYRNVIYASDENNGYSTVIFPTVREALQDGDGTLAARELDDLAARFEEAARWVQRARVSLGR
jgi:N-acetylated-alpha-linked acidic dipeptidase